MFCNLWMSSRPPTKPMDSLAVGIARGRLLSTFVIHASALHIVKLATPSSSSGKPSLTTSSLVHVFSHQRLFAASSGSRNPPSSHTCLHPHSCSTAGVLLKVPGTNARTGAGGMLPSTLGNFSSQAANTR